MNKLKDILEEGERELSEHDFCCGSDFCSLRCGKTNLRNFLKWHRSQQHKLLQSIVEMIDSAPQATRDESQNEKTICAEDLKSKLLELDNG